MYPRTDYEMTQDDLDALLTAMKPVPYMIVGGRPPPSQQENANRAWEALGKKMGFDHMTVRSNNRGDRFFSAVPSETPTQRDARVAREAEEKRQARITALAGEIAARQTELDALKAASSTQDEIGAVAKPEGRSA